MKRSLDVPGTSPGHGQVVEKGTVPKTGPAPGNDHGMGRAMGREPVKATRMVQGKEPAVALEEVTVSGLRDGIPRSHALRGNVPGTLCVRLDERDALGIFLNFPGFTI